MWLFLCIGLLSGWLGSVQVSEAQEQQKLHQQRQELQHIQRQLGQYQRQLRDGTQQEESLLATLDSLSRRQDQVVERIRATEQEIQRTHTRLQEWQRTYDQRAQRVQAQRQLLAQRLRRLYKLGYLPFARLFWSARDVIELTYKVQYMRRIVAYDRQQIRGYQADMASLAHARENLETERQRLLQAQDTLRQQQAALAQERQRKTALLQRIRQEQHVAQQAVAALTHTSQSLARFIDQLRQTHEQLTRHTAVVKGDLRWPVEGSILSPYGRVRHRQLDVYTVQNGMYIGAPMGSDIRAIGAGKVVYAGWFKGFGRLLILDHGEHVVSLYGHASAILVEAGNTVQPHQVVAKVGDSSALGEPALYFEIRHRTVPQDPLLWLRQRAARLAE